MTDTNSSWDTSGLGEAGVVPNHVQQAHLEAENLTRGPSAAMHSDDPVAYSPGTAAEQLAYERGQMDAARRLTTPKMTGWRITCGICWGLWTLLFSIAALVSLAHASFGSFLIAGILAGLAGWYDYRIWALKARRLTIFIIF
jgi:hypothetical protein